MTGTHTQFSETFGGYGVSIRPLICRQSLEAEWQEIEQRAGAPFFLSWAWVSTWLDVLKPDTFVVRVSYAGRLAAIGLFTESESQRRWGIRARQLRLHQVGDNLLDQIWVEYNNLICAPGHHQPAILAAINGLEKAHSGWDEIVISMMPSSYASYVAAHRQRVTLEQHHRCFAVDLSRMRSDGKAYLDSVSANTRYQIRRSIRRYAARFGPLHLERAEDAKTAIAYFREAGPLHQQRWKDSGYDNPAFTGFHEALIARYVNNGVELLRVRSGDMTVAVLYFHQVDDRMYFYLHGLTYDDDAKLKPGLVAHSMAAQYFLDRDIVLYDFMGGYSQYKLQLSDESEPLVTIRIQRPRLSFMLENLGRRIKRRLWPDDEDKPEPD